MFPPSYLPQAAAPFIVQKMLFRQIAIRFREKFCLLKQDAHFTSDQDVKSVFSNVIVYLIIWYYFCLLVNIIRRFSWNLIMNLLHLNCKCFSKISADSMMNTIILTSSESYGTYKSFLPRNTFFKQFTTFI